MPGKINNLIQELMLINDSSLIKSTFEKVPANIDDFVGYIQFNDEGYSRNLVAKTDMFELLVLCWKAGQESKIHNHADSTCMFKVVEGNLTNTVFLQEEKHIILKSITELSRGESCLISDEREYHQISNNSNDDVISIHLYTPPLQQFEQLDSEEKIELGEVVL